MIHLLNCKNKYQQLKPCLNPLHIIFSQMRFSKTDSKSRMNQSELDGAKLEIQSAIDENKKNNHTIAQLTKELGDARTKISHLQVINNGYTSNLKIHKNLQTKLEKDIEREASKKKELVLQIEAGNKRNEEVN